MQINKIGINNINFQANYITISKLKWGYEPSAVSTDNEENLGNEPVLQYEREGRTYEIPMEYDGKYYTSIPTTVSDKYRIYYKDTHQYERGGQVQVIDTPKLIEAAMKAENIFNGNITDESLEEAISKGNIEGRLFVNTMDIPKDVPAILILDKIKSQKDILLLPENVKGVIVTSVNLTILEHIANLVRDGNKLFSIVRNNEKFNNLKNKEGKYLSLNNSSGILEYKEIEPNKLTNDIANPILITPPKLENVEKLLNFDELTPLNCGNKGYRLGVMQRLVRDGILKDINIPNGFVIPEGYVNKYVEYLNVDDKEELSKRMDEGIYYQDTENKIKELGLPRNDLIIRSNYNTEDLGSFSSAGIYTSLDAYDTHSIIEKAVYDVILGGQLLLSDIAKKVYEKYGINEKDIQPSVIIQERIYPDYKYTLYTDDGDNNIIIDLFYMEHNKKLANALIKYNKKTKKLTLERKQSLLARYLFDENGNIVSQKHSVNKILTNWDNICSLLNIVTDGALVLEQYFKHPQDIEGGITKDGKVFFWQTRDIVAKGKKRI